MTTPNYPSSASGATAPTTAGTAGTSDSAAKEQAKQAASTAADEGKHVAGVAKEEAKNVAAVAKGEAANVAGEAKAQARNLLGEAKTQVSDQAVTQRDRVVGTLQSFSSDLQKMARGESAEGGMAQELLRQVADRAQSIGTQIENKQPAELLDEVRRYAQRKPGAFLLGSLVAGVLAGRVTKGAKEASSSDSSSGQAGYAGYSTGYATGSVYDDTRGTAAGYPTAGTGYPESDPVYPAVDPVYPATTTGTSVGGVDPVLGTTGTGLADSPYTDNPSNRGGL